MIGKDVSVLSNLSFLVLSLLPGPCITSVPLTNTIIDSALTNYTCLSAHLHSADRLAIL